MQQKLGKDFGTSEALHNWLTKADTADGVSLDGFVVEQGVDAVVGRGRRSTYLDVPGTPETCQSFLDSRFFDRKGSSTESAGSPSEV